MAPEKNQQRCKQLKISFSFFKCKAEARTAKNGQTAISPIANGYIKIIPDLF
jgi:hypothetical protein